MSKKYQVISHYKPLMGADPELFLSKRGKIVGSEKYIDNKSNVERDGVQVELHPEPQSCREMLASNIIDCFVDLQQQLEKKGVNISLDTSVHIDKNELRSLSEDARALGCEPSNNVYSKTPKCEVNGSKYLGRSAGGHIHISINHPSYMTRNLKASYENYLLRHRYISRDRAKIRRQLVYLMDVVAGNTCVLIDTDEGNIERRKYYGRAGEYRTTNYGIEYRTLSNFWLRAYPLMSLAFGIVRSAYNMYFTTKDNIDYYKEITSLVKRKDISNAINNNDQDLAYSNFDKIKRTYIDMVGRSETYPLNERNIRFFDYFIEKGLEHWFGNKGFRLDTWNRMDNHSGFNDYLLSVVRNEVEGLALHQMKQSI